MKVVLVLCFVITQAYGINIQHAYGGYHVGQQRQQIYQYPQQYYPYQVSHHQVIPMHNMKQVAQHTHTRRPSSSINSILPLLLFNGFGDEDSSTKSKDRSSTSSSTKTKTPEPPTPPAESSPSSESSPSTPSTESTETESTPTPESTPTSEDVYCDELEDLENGSIDCDDGENVGSICDFSCNDGLFLNGESRSLCKNEGGEGEWSNPLPVCEEMCEPFDIENGVVECDAFNIGGMCEVECNEGYRVNGDDFVECLMGSNGDAKWSEKPTCERIYCPEPVTPDDGSVTCDTVDYEYGTVCEFSCNGNHYLVGYLSTSCVDEDGDGVGEWGNASPTCTEGCLSELDVSKYSATSTASYDDGTGMWLAAWGKLDSPGDSAYTGWWPYFSSQGPLYLEITVEGNDIKGIITQGGITQWQDSEATHQINIAWSTDGAIYNYIMDNSSPKIYEPESDPNKHSVIMFENPLLSVDSIRFEVVGDMLANGLRVELIVNCVS